MTNLEKDNVSTQVNEKKNLFQFQLQWVVKADKDSVSNQKPKEIWPYECWRNTSV